VKFLEEIHYLAGMVLLEVHSDFDMQKFKSIDNHLKRFKYFEKHTEFLAMDSSRTVFRLSDQYVLKLANIKAYDEIAEKGQAQNEVEVDVYTNPKTKAVRHLQNELGLDFSDLTRMNHWGGGTDGRLVLLDYGFTVEVADKFYSTY
jgi:hypothetical protein